MEKVLAHYSRKSEDSLKLRAAEFLIKNMPGHYSLDPAIVNAFCDQVDSILATPLDTSLLELAKTNLKEADDQDWAGFKVKAMEAVSKRFPVKPSSSQSDIRILKADYLIRNIENAFETWANAPWAAHLTFDDFCEYILPYKAAPAFQADNWKDECSELADRLYDLTDLRAGRFTCHSPHWAALNINQGLNSHLKTTLPYAYTGLPILRMSTFLKMHLSNCTDKGIVVKAVLQSKGIPVAVDFTPQWPTQAQGHSGNVIQVSNNGRFEEFVPLDTDPGTPHRPGEMMAKVYRQCYALNPVFIRLNNSGEAVPSSLSTVTIKDVTAEYVSTQDVRIRIDPALKKRNKYAYVAVFDNRNWVPVGFGDVGGSEAVFEAIGRDIAYLPVYCSDGEKITPLSYPFTVDAYGKVDLLIPDTVNRESFKLLRKYPYYHAMTTVTKRLISGKIQAANRPDFSDVVTIHEFTEAQSAGEVRIPAETPKYRYWRYFSSLAGFNNMAELLFHPPGSNRSLRGTIIGTPGSYLDDPRRTREAVFDGDPFTFFDSTDPNNSWAGMDFGEPVSIGSVEYAFRSDDNNIRIGDVYELFYWKDESGWESLGKKKAENMNLYYDNIPSHALLLLRDHTRGKEERIFTLENGEQVWW